MLLGMFVSQAALAQLVSLEGDAIVDQRGEFTHVYACGVNASTASDDNTLTFFALVGNSFSEALTAYSPADEAPVAGFERFADDDGCLDYMVKSVDLPSYASLVVKETFSEKVYVLIKGQGQAPAPTPTPTPTPVPNQNESFNKGYQAGQLVATVYNETLALTAYMRVEISDGLASQFQLAHVNALSNPNAFVTSQEADSVERQMYERANNEASTAAINVAKQEATQVVTNAYTAAANNGTAIDPTVIDNLPLPNPVFTAPNINVGEEVSISNITNQAFFNEYVKTQTLNTLYREYLGVLYANWPENVIFRSGTLFDHDGWDFQYIVNGSNSFERQLELVGDNLSTETPYNYVTGSRFNSSDERLLLARHILLTQIPNGTGQASVNGFFQAFNDLYHLPNQTDYRAILKAQLNEHGFEFANFLNLIESQKTVFINKAAKALVLSNYKVEVFEEEFPVAFNAAANDLFLDNYIETLGQVVERFEKNTILDFSNATITRNSEDELGLLSEMSLSLEGVRNIGKKPATSISLGANIAGSNLSLNFPLSTALNFGGLSEASTSASFEIPYNKAYLSFSKSTAVSLSYGRRAVGSLPVSLTAKAYIANFAELFDDICPENADRAKRRSCNARKTDLGDMMGKEVKEIGRKEQFNYYKSFQSGSVVWALTELEQNADLSDVLTHKYRRSSSVRDRVESYKPGLFGNRRVKALFDDALKVIDDVAR